MTAAVDFSSQMLMDDLVAKLLEDDVGDQLNGVSDAEFREPTGLLLNDWLGLFGNSDSSLDSQHSSRLSDWRPSPALSEQSEVDTWSCPALPGKPRNLGSSGSSPESQGSHFRESTFRKLGAFDLGHDGFRSTNDVSQGATFSLGSWLAQPPPLSTPGIEKCPLNLDQSFLSACILDPPSRRPHVDPFSRSHSPVLFDASVPPPNLAPFNYLPPEMSFSVPPPTYTPKEYNGFQPVGLFEPSLSNAKLPSWKTGPPPPIPVKNTPSRNLVRPGSPMDLNQRLEECRFKLKLLNADRRRTEAELRAKFGNIQFNAYVQGQRFAANRRSLDRLIFDFVKQHAWVAALFVGMRMIRGDNQFSFRSVETLLQDWMEAIKKVERKAVQLGSPVENFPVKIDSGFPVNYSAICESLSELGNYCREVRTAMWSALQLTLALKPCPEVNDNEPQV